MSRRRTEPDARDSEVAEILRAALRQHRSGAFDRARELYGKALSLNPNHPDGLHLAGVLAFQQGRLADATAAIDRAIARAPKVADFWNSRGAVRRAAGELDGARADLEQALLIKPDYADARVSLGEVLVRLGRLSEGRAMLELAIRHHPENARAHDALGVALMESGQHDEAIDAFVRASEFAPTLASAKCHLGAALAVKGDREPALNALRDAVRIDPQFVEAHFNLGNVLQSSGDLLAAIAAYRRAVEIDPFYLKSWNNLGLALRDAGDSRGACDCFEQALAIGGDKQVAASCANNLANLLAAQGNFGGAIVAFERALSLNRDSAEIHLNFARTLHKAKSTVLAEIHAARAFELDSAQRLPVELCLHSTLFGTMAPEQLVAQAHHAAGLLGLRGNTASVHSNDRDTNRRLRIGYISPDFRVHSVAYFIEPILRTHDRAVVEVFCYSSVEVSDSITSHLRGLADHWREIHGLSDAAAAQLVRLDAIDILIDLAGQTRNNRLGIFALRPAPVQVTWIGYAGPTGVDAIEWRLTDALADPAGLTDAHFPEKLVRLDGGFLCYAPLRELPDPRPPYARQDGILFGSFNHIGKVREGVIELWAEILRKLPQARLMLKSQGLDRPTIATMIRAQFANYGIAAGRLHLLDFKADQRAHLECYRDISVALDPFPYNGTTTTCEALWMGVPVVTLAGSEHRSRVGVSLLTRAGLPDLIARDRAHYVEIAVALATDSARLAELHRDLRRHVATSALSDAGKVTAGLESALRRIWRDWCECPAA